MIGLTCVLAILVASLGMMVLVTHQAIAAPLPSYNGSNVPYLDMQQATVNLLPDVGVQPVTLKSGLVDATASTDTTSPASTITASISGITSTRSARITVAGKATATALLSPTVGPGGPIMVITSSANPFTQYYAEILRTEGFNAFTVTNISRVTSALLNSYDVVILGEMSLTSAQVVTFTNWVTAGGNLIAMRPDKKLASLLGMNPISGTLANAYLQLDTAQASTTGLVTQTIQYHGTADLYTVNGAAAVAILYSDATTPTANPAVTLRSVGPNGGQAAAFTYDLARSVVYTRQGNPAWAGQERDGQPPIRSDDLFFGDASYDPQPDWIDLNKVAIPQADEQQRLLANLIEQMNLDKKPLPRFWYLPFGKKAAVVMTGDDHGSGGTSGRFDQYLADSAQGCSVDDWQCIRSTSYMYSGSIDPAQAASYAALGFEVALHVNTGCADYTLETLTFSYTDQLTDFGNMYPDVPAPITHRIHCVVWSDWATQAHVELSHSIRLDTSYYYWPSTWIQDQPGFFTGSGMPMRFADVDGTLIDVYQAATQMTDESGQTYPDTIDTLLDRALGPEGYYGAFVANMHTDLAASPESDAIVASATARGVPLVSARQMLGWLDGRNSSSFQNLSWAINVLSFNVITGTNTNGLEVMVPITSTAGALYGVTYNGSPVAYQVQSINGMSYAFLLVRAGAYLATYGSAKADQTITFAALADKVIGDPPFSVTATASSGLPVTFTVSGACTNSGISGAIVTVTGLGSCTVTANQGGNATYNAAPSVARTFNIAKANQTITFAPLPDKVYNDPAFTVVATATSSLPVTFTVSGACTNSGATVTVTGVGSCTVTANQNGNAIYNAAPSVAQTFSIAKANQTITFAVLADKVIGDPPFSVTATASSGLPVTFTVSGDCTISGSMLTLVTAGSCTVMAQQAGNTNYTTASEVAHSFNIQAVKIYLALIMRSVP